MIEKELLDFDSPLDPFNVHYSKQEIKQDLVSTKIKTTDLDLLSGEIPLPMILDLPEVPNTGVIPIMSSKGQMFFLRICADKNRFKFTQEELDKGSINLYNHIEDFMPKNGKQIALITSINGINTSLKEYGEHCQADNKMIAAIMGGDPSREEGYEHPLYLGLYNTTEGLLSDAIRAVKTMYHGKQDDAPYISSPDDFVSGMLQIAKDSIPDFRGFTEGVKDYLRNSPETQNIEIAREFLSKVATTAKEINPAFRWVIIEHSEGGLVYCRSFKGMSEETQKIMREHTLNIALGPAEPISKEMASEAVNFYSDKDYVTKRFAEKFMNNPNYEIYIIPCKSSRGELSFLIADHARDGTTYTKARDGLLQKNEEDYGFYDGKEHE